MKKIIKLTESKLFEIIKRVISEELQQIKPNKTLYHLSRYTNRESIRKNGLTPKIGSKTKQVQKYRDKNDDLSDFVYVMYNPSNIDKAMFGFDTWEINTNGLNASFYKDPNHTEEGLEKWFVTKSHIPASNLKLVDENKPSDDYYMKVEKEGFPKTEPEPIDEPETINEPDEWEKLLSKTGDNDFITMNESIKYILIQESIKTIESKIYNILDPKDKKELYFLIKNSDVDSVKKKMEDLIEKLSNTLGEENKKFITNYLKKMVYKMYTSTVK